MLPRFYPEKAHGFPATSAARSEATSVRLLGMWDGGITDFLLLRSSLFHSSLRLTSPRVISKNITIEMNLKVKSHRLPSENISIIVLWTFQ